MRLLIVKVTATYWILLINGQCAMSFAQLQRRQMFAAIRQVWAVKVPGERKA